MKDICIPYDDDDDDDDGGDNDDDDEKQTDHTSGRPKLSPHCGDLVCRQKKSVAAWHIGNIMMRISVIFLYLACSQYYAVATPLILAAADQSCVESPDIFQANLH